MSEEIVTIEFAKVPVGARVPKLGVAVLVETLGKERYVAARFEVRQNIYAWGLVLRNKIIGKVDSVAYWFEGL